MSDLLPEDENIMDAFSALASTATSTFASTTGYSYTEFTLFAQMVQQVFLLQVTQFLMYNAKWIVAATGLIVFLIVPFALLARFSRPARR